MALDEGTMDSLKSWWHGLSVDDRALVERHAKIPSDSEELREVVFLSGLTMVRALEWSARSPLYQLPDPIREFLRDPTPVPR